MMDSWEDNQEAGHHILYQIPVPQWSLVVTNGQGSEVTFLLSLVPIAVFYDKGSLLEGKNSLYIIFIAFS